MTLDVVALALVTAVCWGGRSTITKLGTERGGTPLQGSITVIVVSIAIFLAALGAVGGNPLDQPLTAIALFVGIGLLGSAVARFALYTGIERVGASVNSAGNNTRPMFAVAMAVIFLGEGLSVQTGLGIVIVVAGLVAVALSGGGDVTGWATRDLVFPLTAAFLFAVANVLRRFGLSTTPMTALEGATLNEVAGLVGLCGYVLARHADDLAGFRSAPPGAYAYFGIGGVLNAAALFALFAALDRGSVVLVDPIAGTTSLFAILFSIVLLGDVERVTARLLAGAVLVVLGGVLITGPQVLPA